MLIDWALRPGMWCFVSRATFTVVSNVNLEANVLFAIDYDYYYYDNDNDDYVNNIKIIKQVDVVVVVIVVKIEKTKLGSTWETSHYFLVSHKPGSGC